MKRYRSLCVIISVVLTLSYNLRDSYSNPGVLLVPLAGAISLGVVGASTYISQHPNLVGDITNQGTNLAVNAFAYNAAYGSLTAGFVYAVGTTLQADGVAFNNALTATASGMYQNLKNAINSTLTPVANTGTVDQTGQVYHDNSGNAFKILGPWQYVGINSSYTSSTAPFLSWVGQPHLQSATVGVLYVDKGLYTDQYHEQYYVYNCPIVADAIDPVTPQQNNPPVAGAMAPAIAAVPAARQDLANFIAAQPGVMKPTDPAPTAQQTNTQLAQSAIAALNNSVTGVQQIAAANPTNVDAQIAAQNATAAQAQEVADEQAKANPQTMGPYTGTGAKLDFSEWQGIKTQIQACLPVAYFSSLLGYVSAFNSIGNAPVFQLPFGKFGTMVCDLSIFNPVVLTFKIMIVLFFNVAMTLVTIRLWSTWG
ncbi:MAG: hypothetical protein P4L42_14860 [Desulfocapsaceae bacterium]|nr:hypothetical protein [Desulfocapsaceae bacterium]